MEALEKGNCVNFATLNTAEQEVTASIKSVPAALTIKDTKINLPKLSDSILEQLKCDVSIAVTRVREGTSTINMVNFNINHLRNYDFTCGLFIHRS